MKNSTLTLIIFAFCLSTHAQSQNINTVQMLGAFSTDQKQQCFVRYPATWIAREEYHELSVIPGPEDPLARFAFEFRFSFDNLSPFDKVYGISISNVISAADIHEAYPAISIAEARAIKAERLRRALNYQESVLVNSNVFDDVAKQLSGIKQTLHSHAPVVMAIPLRIRYSPEEGAISIATENLQVRRDTNQTVANATLFPTLVATEVKAAAGSFTMTCTASPHIPMNVFAEACRLFIERISLSTDFPSGRCVANHGALEFSGRK